ncbi:MAG: N-acetylmuramoyl-L-alanine amidase [Prevotella sp.]|nr:N-acetylmuramoyl-L-alanine amidase [Prevotella sp.]MCM1074053.1 N-acetylmuramoyl-L-alanine amidase [Ruminococcus sp.]
MKLKYIYNNSLRFIIVLILCVLGVGLVSAASKYTVVIDAGHGGKDHGAIDNNVREKDINLAVALKVGEYIKKNSKNIKVVYTRDKDEYLTLQQRADKANKEKGDLFISIHTNSLDKSNPKRTTVAGASTYTLGLHKDNDNMTVARRENSVMTLEPNYETAYSGFDPRSDESYIIFEMAQKGNMANSVKFAEQVQKQLTKTADRQDRGVHQAGFWVLWATSMPAVLVELDFICNPTSAKYLSSSSGQSKLAAGIGSAAVAYFKALEQHDKNRLRTQKDEPAEIDSYFSGNEGVILASVAEEEVKKAAPQEVMPGERTRRPASRRRRSDASREKSERRQYAEAVIKEDNVYVDHKATTAQSVSTTAQQPGSKKTQPKAAEKSAKNKNNNKTKTKVKPVEKQVVASASTVSDKSATSPKKTSTSKKSSSIQAKSADKGKLTRQEEKSPVKMAKVTTVYKIQILASKEPVKAGSPLFHGLSPVTCIPDGDCFRYVYGESTNHNEIYHLLSDVQKTIPDAQVIKYRKSL